MPVEKGQVLFLKGLPAVMFPLPFDVANHIWQPGPAYAESNVTVLPGKGTSAKRFMEPLTGSAFK
jgi:hypothetical protein